MIADVSVVGERGQITIPKNIRDSMGLMPKDSVLVKVSEGKVILEKLEDERKQDEKMLKEYYIAFAKRSKKLAKEWSGTLEDIK